MKKYVFTFVFAALVASIAFAQDGKLVKFNRISIKIPENWEYQLMDKDMGCKDLIQLYSKDNKICEIDIWYGKDMPERNLMDELKYSAMSNRLLLQSFYIDPFL